MTQELSTIFVDSSAFLALLDKNDENHQRAVIIISGLSKRHVLLFTTNFVRAEAHALILSVLGASVARRFLCDKFYGYGENWS